MFRYVKNTLFLKNIILLYLVVLKIALIFVTSKGNNNK